MQNALTDFLLAQKKMAELKPLILVVTNRNAAINPHDQTEVPCPLPCILYILFPNNGALPYEKHYVFLYRRPTRVVPFSLEGQRSPPPAPLPLAAEAIFY